MHGEEKYENMGRRQSLFFRKKQQKQQQQQQQNRHGEISVVLDLLSVPPLRVHEDGPITFPVDRT